MGTILHSVREEIHTIWAELGYLISLLAKGGEMPFLLHIYASLLEYQLPQGKLSCLPQHAQYLVPGTVNTQLSIGC